MTWPPSRSTLLLCLASGSCGYFVIGTVAGLHPDGALLGFSAALFAAWDNEKLQARRRQERRERTPRPAPAPLGHEGTGKGAAPGAAGEDEEGDD